MNNAVQLTSHEMLKLHEMIRSEVLGIKKIKAMAIELLIPKQMSALKLSSNRSCIDYA